MSPQPKLGSGSGPGSRRKLTVVDDAAMGDRDGDDHKLHILDFAKNAIVADPVAPEASKVVAESFAKRTRICGGSDSQLKISEDLPLDRGRLCRPDGGDALWRRQRPACPPGRRGGPCKRGLPWTRPCCGRMQPTGSRSRRESGRP